MTKPRKTHRDAAEQTFLLAYDPSAYERLSIAVDVVLLSVVDDGLVAYVIRRDEHPFAGTWTLPGGFVQPDESLDEAAARVLKTKARVTKVFVEQLYTFGAPRRDPRTRVISVAYYALVPSHELAEMTDTAHALASVTVPWEGELGGPVELRIDERVVRVGFDHAEILGAAVKRLRGKLGYAPIGFQLLGAEFTLLELQRVHEAVLGRTLNKDSFRRRMLASGGLVATGKMLTDVAHRPAELFRVANKR